MFVKCRKIKLIKKAPVELMSERFDVYQAKPFTHSKPKTSRSLYSVRINDDLYALILIFICVHTHTHRQITSLSIQVQSEQRRPPIPAHTLFLAHSFFIHWNGIPVSVLAFCIFFFVRSQLLFMPLTRHVFIGWGARSCKHKWDFEWLKCLVTLLFNHSYTIS